MEIKITCWGHACPSRSNRKQFSFFAIADGIAPLCMEIWLTCWEHACPLRSFKNRRLFGCTVTKQGYCLFFVTKHFLRPSGDYSYPRSMFCFTSLVHFASTVCCMSYLKWRCTVFPFASGSFASQLLFKKHLWRCTVDRPAGQLSSWPVRQSAQTNILHYIAQYVGILIFIARPDRQHLASPRLFSLVAIKGI